MAAQAGLCLAWSEAPEDTFCHVVAHLVFGLAETSKVSWNLGYNIYRYYTTWTVNKKDADQTECMRMPICDSVVCKWHKTISFHDRALDAWCF